jgi:hypothetical protein
MPKEDIVSQYQGRAASANEFGANQKRLGYALRPGLLGILNVNSPSPAVAKQMTEQRQIVWRRYQQEFLNAGEH